MNKDILKIAKECGFTEMQPYDYGVSADRGIFLFNNLIKFAQALIEQCALVADDRANKCAKKADDADSIEDEIELKANAWQFSVLATDIRRLKESE